MMWDFSSSSSSQRYRHQNYDSDNQPLPPIGMPSPFSSYAPSQAPIHLSPYESNPIPFPRSSHTSSAFLNVPSPLVPGGEIPRAVSAQGHSYHHHHQHHHHSHHRVHSTSGVMPPIPLPPRQSQQQRPVSAHVGSFPEAFDTQPLSSHRQRSTAVPGASAGTFQYSRCTGRKKALCIGINYTGMPVALRGCINDSIHVRKFLTKHWGYDAEYIVTLTDDETDPRKRPTKANILAAMRWLVKDAQPNDSLFFHYSGHGGQTRDRDGDEIDGYDEVIYPLDFKTQGHIVDDLMHEIMVKSLPRGCRLTTLFDCCHSGTVLDLPYIYGSDGRLKGRQVSQKARARKGTSADVVGVCETCSAPVTELSKISWSGSKDGQTSADTFAGGVAVGAMSYAFITSLRQNPKQTYQELLRSVRKILYPKYSQKPQLGSSHHIDTSLRFIM